MMDWSDLAYEAEHLARDAFFEHEEQAAWEVAISAGHSMQWAAILTLTWLLTKDDE